MTTGLAYGVAVDADLDLGLPVTDRPAEVRIRARPGRVETATVRWLPDAEDGPWRAGLVPDGFVLRFLDEAELLIAADGTAIGWSVDGTTPETLVHLVLDHALPHCLMRRGRLVLHGSCLATGDWCYAVSGRSGAGKSTLAAALRASGHRFLGDDCVAVEVSGGDGDGDRPPVVAPAYPGLRLHPGSDRVVDLSDLAEAGPVSSLTEKRRLALADGSDWDGEARHPLRAVFVLADATGPDSEGRGRLTGAAALLALLPHSFHLAQGDDRAALLNRAALLAERCEVHELVYHHSPDGLVATVARITGVVARSGAAPPAD